MIANGAVVIGVGDVVWRGNRDDGVNIVAVEIDISTPALARLFAASFDGVR